MTCVVVTKIVPSVQLLNKQGHKIIKKNLGVCDGPCTQNRCNSMITISQDPLVKIRPKFILAKIGATFPIKREVRQGNPLSPKIFLSVYESIFRCLNWETRGV